jgi:hypothetical protein
MKGVLPWLVRLARRYKRFLSCLVFQFICPHFPASWASSHEGSPVAVDLCLIEYKDFRIIQDCTLFLALIGKAFIFNIEHYGFVSGLSRDTH